MESSIYINNIPVTLPEREILARLRFNFQRTKMSPEDRKRITMAMNRAFGVCNSRGLWIRLEISEIKPESVIFSDSYEMVSSSIAKLLENSRAVILMATTVGPEVVVMASKAMEEEAGADALIYDSVGSETADAAMDWLNRYLESEVRRRGEKLTKMRFSPGYGDLALHNQQWFYDKLEMSKLDVTLSERYIFNPEKTVTAIVGVE